MSDLTNKVQTEEFEISVQYCDSDDCLHDCIHEGINNCDAVALGVW